METSPVRMDRDSCARGFVRAAQYLANVLASADVLAESREIIRAAFSPDFVCVCQRACEGCDVPAASRAVVRPAVDQVIDTGFMTMERVPGEPPTAYAVLPVSVRGRTEAALLVGFSGEPSLPAHLLEVLLGVAGLVGATLARQRADRERVLLAEERAARAVAEVTERRSRLLSEVSKALSASFDYESMLGRVAQLLVPELCDGCTIDLCDGDDPAARRRVAAAGVDPARLGAGPAIVAPLEGHDAVLGALTLGPRSGGGQGPEDLALAEEIGRRAGTAIENARLYRQAQEAIGVRDQFLAVASHELKTPLTALLLVLAGAERSLDRLPSVPPLMRSKIAALSRQGHRLNRLVSDLLDVSRIQSGRLHVTIERVDLCAVVRDVVERHQQEAASAGCAVEVLAPGQVTGAWDQSRVDQVVSNLLSNALKYGAGKPVSITARSDGDLAILTVADRGIGIAPGDHERIFQRFERAVACTGFSGMGLGLWIVREIVGRLGGRIRVESELGAGARFTVELPVRPEGPREKDPSPLPHPAQRPGVPGAAAPDPTDGEAGGLARAGERLRRRR